MRVAEALVAAIEGDRVLYDGYCPCCYTRHRSRRTAESCRQRVLKDLAFFETWDGDSLTVDTNEVREFANHLSILRALNSYIATLEG